jgi:hypothetical protein
MVMANQEHGAEAVSLVATESYGAAEVSEPMRIAAESHDAGVRATEAEFNRSWRWRVEIGLFALYFGSWTSGKENQR